MNKDLRQEIGKILCFLGIHNWKLDLETAKYQNPKLYFCDRCYDTKLK